MNYIYGPLQSRRLGLSLGVDITPYKTCPLDCVYCQLKHTTKLTLERKEYVRVKRVLSELKEFLSTSLGVTKLDSITLSGSGEPLLHAKIKDIISGIKEQTAIPVAVITNSVLLRDAAVRKDIREVDIAIPSLDAVTQDVFEKIDRPFSKNIHIDDIIEGLVRFRQEFKGKLWLEIMMIKGVNDNIEYAQEFQRAILMIRPDKIQLTRPTRPPSEPWVQPPLPGRLKKIKEIIGEKCEIV